MNDTEKVVVREWVKPGQKDEEKGRFTTSPASLPVLACVSMLSLVSSVRLSRQ